ncbi:MAG: ABC transporter permease [Carbonactinosporaceae bacterium]
MYGSYSAELLKLRKRPATWVLLAAMLVLYHLFSFALPYSSYLTGGSNFETTGVPPREALAATLPGQLVANSLGGYPVFVGAIALILGALAVGSEYGWGTLKTLLTQGPSRLGVFGAKLLALATATLVAVLATVGTGAAVSSAIAVAEGEPLNWPGVADLGLGMAAGWLILTMWAMFGALLGFVFRGVALPIGLGVVWVLGVENLISGVASSLLTSLQGLRDVLPGVNAGSLVSAVTAGTPDVGSATPGVIDAVDGTRAALTLLTYVAVFAVVAGLALRRRDVT